MEIKPIRTDEDHAAALEEIESHWGAEPGTPEGDRLDVLLALLRAYEDERHAIPPPDPIDAIRFRLEQLGLDAAALQSIIGHRGRVSEILNRKRPLTLEMIRRLHVELGIPSDVLIAEYPLSRAG
jgi:HTH-type transcriptional regulator/antitoxin HigA